MTSTGSPLAPEGFDFVYETGQARRPPRVDLRRHRHHRPLCRRQPERAGVAGRAPGADARHEGRGVRRERDGRSGGEKGELVCTMPFPSMPVGFWNDPDGRKYHAAYFEQFPGVWWHGDYVELTGHDGADHLRPLGRRAEPRRRADRHGRDLSRGRADRRKSSRASSIGQHWDHDERVVLFVRLQDGLTLDGSSRNASAPGSGRTLRRAMSRRGSSRCRRCRGRAAARSSSWPCATSSTAAPCKNREALANPEALDAVPGSARADSRESRHRIR